MRISRQLLPAVAAATALATPAMAVSIDGSINAAEGWSSVFTSAGVEVFVQSDIDNLYFAGDTPDDDDGSPSPGNFDDAFNMNFGLDGNAAAWRYRLLSENQSFNNNGEPSAQLDGVWEGFLQGGDDSVVANTTFGVPGSLTNLSLGGVQYAVSDVNGNRQHEVAIPWATLLDGNNGWERGNLALRIGGFYAEDGSGTALPATIDFGDQSTYALETVTAPVPLPAPALLLGVGLATLGAARRFKR